MYSELTPESAKTQSSQFLVRALNECRSDSGAYIVAKCELEHRDRKRAHRQRAIIAAVVAALGALGFLLRAIV